MLYKDSKSASDHLLLVRNYISEIGVKKGWLTVTGSSGVGFFGPTKPFNENKKFIGIRISFSNINKKFINGLDIEKILDFLKEIVKNKYPDLKINDCYILLVEDGLFLNGDAYVAKIQIFE